MLKPLYSLCIIGLYCAAPSLCIAQVGGKCSYCVQIACNSQWAWKCSPSGARKCTRSGYSNGCYLSCDDSTQCPFDSSLNPSSSACDPSRWTPALQAIAQKRPELKASPVQVTEDEMQRAAAKEGGAGIITELQTSAPVTFIHARHDADDMLGASTVLNQSSKVVISIRFGWSVKPLDGKTEVKLGEWVSFPNGLQPAKSADVPAQRIDPAPLHKVGNFVKLYIAQVKFEDGSTWERSKTNQGRA